MAFMAADKGWFRAEGLGPVEVAPLGTEDDRLTLAELAAGRADIVWDAHSDLVVQADAAGAALSVIDVFRSSQPVGRYLFGAKGLTAVEDLKGRRVGVNEIDGMNARQVRKALSLAGIQPDRDVVLVPRMRGVYGPGSERDVLEKGVVDAISADHERAEELRRAGFPVLANLAEVFPRGYPIRFMVARRKVTEDHPAAIEAFLRAIGRARRRASDERNAAEVRAVRRRILEEDLSFGGERAEAARMELAAIEKAAEDGEDAPPRQDYYDAEGVEFLIEEQRQLERVPASYSGDDLTRHAYLLKNAIAELDRRHGTGGY
jgi:ABC-type nitrate/sulfonate/bicarbonate transport system substrate-binding protein